jgi:hypothetical protein
VNFFHGPWSARETGLRDGLDRETEQHGMKRGAREQQMKPSGARGRIADEWV